MKLSVLLLCLSCTAIARIARCSSPFTNDDDSLLLEQQRGASLTRSLSSNTNPGDERIGIYTLLAVRVTSSFGQTPRESLQDIQNAVFDAEHSLVNQFAAISQQKLLYIPAITATTGVIQVRIPKQLGLYQDDEDEIVKVIEERLGVTSIHDVADRVIFCLPDGSLEDGVWGLAQFPGRRSYYHKKGCTKLGLMMHELGHNLWFDHSGVGDDEYEDRSGYMGGSDKLEPVGIFSRVFSVFRWNKDRPLRRAFNGHKHWISGWFDRQQTSLNLQSTLSGSFLIRIVCFVDASKSAETVLLRVDPIFIQFNCAKDYNVDAEVPNTVTFTEGIAPRAPSNRLAALGKGGQFSYTFERDGDWTFQVCSIGHDDEGISAALLSIHKSSASSTCPDPVIPDPESWPVLVDTAIHSNDGFLKFLGSLILTSFALIVIVGIQSSCDGLFCLLLRTQKGAERQQKLTEVAEKEPLSPSNSQGTV